MLSTGRVAHQWHTRTKTGKVASLNKLDPGPYLEVNVEDAARLDVVDGDLIEITSRRGRVRLPARLTFHVSPGGCWAPLHWNDEFGSDLCINEVTSEIACPESKQPELKFCPVRLERVKTNAECEMRSAEWETLHATAAS